MNYLFNKQNLNNSLEKISNKPATLFIPVLLFCLFSPGLLFNLNYSMDYPYVSLDYGVAVSSSDYFNSSSFYSMLLHTLLFAVVYFVLLTKFPQYY